MRYTILNVVIREIPNLDMDEDDGGPPMLVDAADGNSDPAEARLSAEMNDVKVARVPITVITGRFAYRASFTFLPFMPEHSIADSSLLRALSSHEIFELLSTRPLSYRKYSSVLSYLSC